MSRTALVFLGAASPALLVLFLWSHPAGEIGFALIAAAFPVALMALGARRREGLGPLRLPLAALLLWLCGSMLAMLLLRGRVTEAPWVGGLPLATAVLLYGVYLLPLPLITLTYALTFERFGLRSEQLEELARRFGRGKPPEG